MQLLFPLVFLMVGVGISTAFPDKSYPVVKEEHLTDSKGKVIADVEVVKPPGGKGGKDNYGKPVVPVVVVVVEPTPAHYNGGKPGYSGSGGYPGYSGGGSNPGYSGSGNKPGYSGNSGKPGYSGGGSYSG